MGPQTGQDGVQTIGAGGKGFAADDLFKPCNPPLDPSVADVQQQGIGCHDKLPKPVSDGLAAWEVAFHRGVIFPSGF